MSNLISKKSPIFIVGSPRSGTTLLRLMLDSHPNISCGPETHFLTQFKHVISGNSWERIKNFGFEKSYWNSNIANFFDSFQKEYACNRGKQRWADKTPGYTLELDFINNLFPDCQIIHIIRDGRDVVSSHRDRWGYKVALKSTKTWQKYVSAAREFSHTISSERYIEIRYEGLVSDTEPTLRNVFEFLNEPWDPIVLNFNQVSHDIHEVYAQSTDERRTTNKDKNLIYKSQIGKGKEKLDLGLKMALNFRAGKLMKELGYL